LILADTSFLYALGAERDARHAQAVAWHGHDGDDLVTTPFVLVEIDHLVRARRSRVATAAFRADVAAGTIGIEWWRTAAEEAAEIAELYGDLGVSLTDASLVALADRLETARIATFDERHFRALRPLRREAAFTLVPLDD
jgi:predicted nucleic acid-binding protein